VTADQFSTREEVDDGAVVDARCWRCEARPPATDVGLCGACHYALVEEEYVAATPPLRYDAVTPEALASALAAWARAVGSAMEAAAVAFAQLAPAVRQATEALGPLLRLLSHEPGPCPYCLSTLPKRGACRRCVARP
jgi:hypothetical protein